MSEAYFSPTTLGFYPAAWKDDGTYTEATWPKDAVLLTDEQSGPYYRQSPPPGKMIGVADGLPVWVDIPPQVLTPEQEEQKQRNILLSKSQTATNQKSALTNRIGVLKESIEYEMATPEEQDELPLRVSQREAWGRYAVLLGRVTSQAGWYETVAWPEKPAGGMDLSVSAARS